jgi:phosphatidylcholine synthase
VLPWLAHLYTALGAVVALQATLAVVAGDFRAAFLWLGAQIAIDSTDGLLARALHVHERLPFFDGALLDNIIDYLTYVFIPVLLLLEAGLLPPNWGRWAGAFVLIASGYGFSRRDAKVKASDYFFTGFPSYWNIVALYMFVLRLSPAANAIVLLIFGFLVFVPLRYVYPSRTMTLRPLTLALGLAWGAMVAWIAWRLPAIDGPWAGISLVFPIYYFALSMWLDYRSRRA